MKLLEYPGFDPLFLKDYEAAVDSRFVELVLIVLFDHVDLIINVPFLRSFEPPTFLRHFFDCEPQTRLEPTGSVDAPLPVLKVLVFHT